MSLLVLYQLYCYRFLEGQRKLVHILIKDLYYKVPNNGNQLPAFPFEGRLGFKL